MGRSVLDHRIVPAPSLSEAKFDIVSSKMLLPAVTRAALNYTESRSNYGVPTVLVPANVRAPVMSPLAPANKRPTVAPEVPIEIETAASRLPLKDTTPVPAKVAEVPTTQKMFLAWAWLFSVMEVPDPNVKVVPICMINTASGLP